MPALTSSSTLADAQAAFIDNSMYDSGSGDVTLFIQACRVLLLMLPKLASHGGGAQVQLTPEMVAKELKNAQSWNASDSASSRGVIYPDFTNARA
jgi:hypothetical protein